MVKCATKNNQVLIHLIELGIEGTVLHSLIRYLTFDCYTGCTAMTLLNRFQLLLCLKHEVLDRVNYQCTKMLQCLSNSCTSFCGIPNVFFLSTVGGCK